MERITNSLDQVTWIQYNNNMEYEFQYGADEEVAKVTDHVNGMDTLYIYDENGQLKKMANSDGTKIDYLYDSKDRLTSWNTRFGSTNKLTTYTYDDRDNGPGPP